MEIDYQDDAAFASGTAEPWLNTFIKVLRTKLPSHLIVCTVSAGYFSGWAVYTKGGFLNVHKQRGDKIDFYNVRYFDQGDSTFNTAATLFTKSTGWAVKTSVKELIDKGIPSEKIVIGKPATSADTSAPASYMSPSALSTAISEGFSAHGWKTGVMIYQLSSDLNGSIMKQVVQPIVSA